jgi:hypothetical protein
MGIVATSEKEKEAPVLVTHKRLNVRVLQPNASSAKILNRSGRCITEDRSQVAHASCSIVRPE